jgi:uncharacterized membrane protein
MRKTKMNTKKTMVSFLAVAFVLSLVATISAYTVTGDLASNVQIKVDGVDVNTATNNIAVTAGETMTVKVYFTSLVGNASLKTNSDGTNVIVKADLEGEKSDVLDRSAYFDVESGKTYVETLTLQVPYDLQNQVSDNLDLSIKIWNGDHESEINGLAVRVQRPSYNADIKSVSVANTVSAGDTFPVDIVVKNRGYNDLNDLYVTVAIPALGIQKSAYFGDLVVQKDPADDSSTETVNGRIYLTVPYDVKAGTYTISVDAANDDTESAVTGQLVVENDFPSSAIATTLSKTANVGEDATYSLLVVNPTNKLKVYSIVPESTSDVLTVANPAVIAVPAGSSGTVQITANADKEGKYNFNVNVISGTSTVNTASFSLNVEGGQTTTTSPIVVLTIVLAIIFIVLLVVLIVLLGKKPEKTEEFGESYY